MLQINSVGSVFFFERFSATFTWWIDPCNPCHQELGIEAVTRDDVSPFGHDDWV